MSCHVVGPQGGGEAQGAGQSQREAAGGTQQTETDRDGDLVFCLLYKKYLLARNTKQKIIVMPHNWPCEDSFEM